MTDKEVGNIFLLAMANFPHLQEKNMKPTLMLWKEMLTDLPYAVALPGMKKLLSTAKFFPSIAEIREACTAMTEPRQLTHDEAWRMVLDAVSKYSSYKELEGLASLPPMVRDVARNIGWREICMSEQPDVIRGQFRQAWEAHSAREKEMRVLPSDVRVLVGNLGDILKLPEGDKPYKTSVQGKTVKIDLAIEGGGSE